MPTLSLAGTTSGGYTDTVRSTITLSLVVLVLQAASVASAQASQLGSPYPPGSAAAATVTAPTTVIAPIAPPSYDQVGVPSAPHTSATIYPAPRGPMLADAPGLHIATSIATRLRVLDGDLQTLAMRGGGDYFGPIVQLVLGGAMVGFGVWMQLSPSSSTASWYPGYFFVTAGGSISRAILSLVLTSVNNPTGPAIRYSHMPMASSRDVRDRLRYGESQLDSLADLARIGRILDGSISIATGLAVLPIIFGSGTFQTSDFFGWLLLAFSAVQVVVGVVSLATTTWAEQRQAAYHELRDRLLATEVGSEDAEMLEREAADETASQVSVTPAISLGPSSGFAGATVAF